VLVLQQLVPFVFVYLEAGQLLLLYLAPLEVRTEQVTYLAQSDPAFGVVNIVIMQLAVVQGHGV